jgi:nicotinamidase-related amidase
LDFHHSTVTAYADHGPQVLPNTVRALHAARKTSIPVIYVVGRFRPGHPEINPRNDRFLAAVQAADRRSAGDAQAREIHPQLAAGKDDIVVVKKRVSGFAGNELDMILRSQDIAHLVLAGIATSGVVLSTLRAASDLDYRLSVLSDCCSDPDPEVHRVLIEKVFPTQAEVTEVAWWEEGLRQAPS